MLILFVHLTYQTGEKIEIISIENYVTPEEEYANDLFDEYEKRNKDVPNLFIQGYSKHNINISLIF